VRRLPLIPIAGLLVAVASLVILRGSGADEPHQQRVLLISETRGYHHASIPDSVRFYELLGRRSRRFEVTRLRHARDLTPERLRDSDAVIFASTTGELPISDAGRQALIDFVKKGGALIGSHSATNTFDRWPRFQRLLGAGFRHHPPAQTGRVIVEDRHSPATSRLPRTFRIRDEFYEFKSSPRRRVHVLIRADPDSIEGENGRDLPLVWCRRVGKGRVFYSAFGHFPGEWNHDQRNRRIVEGGLRWALKHGHGRCGHR
jgi:uncharacterized protein